MIERRLRSVWQRDGGRFAEAGLAPTRLDKDRTLSRRFAGCGFATDFAPRKGVLAWEFRYAAAVARWLADEVIE